MKVLGKLMAIVGVLALVGCASTKFNYVAEKPAADADGYLFSISEVSINLISEKQPEGYLNAAQLSEVLAEKLQGRLQEKQLYSGDSSLSVNVNVDYQRKFGYGDSLARPVFTYELNIFKDGKKIASRAIGKSTTDHGYFGQAAVNAQIGTGTWDEEDEPEDIDMIAASISSDLEKF